MYLSPLEHSPIIHLGRSRAYAPHVLRAFGVVCAIMMASTSIATAQPGRPMRGPGAQRLEQFRKIRLMEALKLDEETSVRFFSRFNKHQEEVQEIVERRSEKIDKLFKEMKKEDENVDYGTFIDETIAMERDIIDARATFLKSLTDILTKRQVAQYVVFERRFNQDVREMLREMNQQRMRR